ncbi:hypothetical protein MP228_007208 [Amoeboaphelidium protococcarum]|nr:hypothetical protein MP228_007208 [Amoeboaphelidium protococcarum]
MIDHALLRIKTRLFKTPAAHLHPLDKIYFKESAEDIIADLNQLISELSGQEYVSSLHRKKLVVCVRLAAYFSRKIDNQEDLISMLTAPINKRNSYIKKEHKEILINCVKALRAVFEEIVSAKGRSEQNICQQFNVLDLGGGVLDQLELGPFDKLFDLQYGGILDSTWNELSKAGVWQASPDYENQKLVVCGEHHEDKFFTMLSNNIPKEFIEYYQEDRPSFRVFDDYGTCSHGGCKVKFEEAFDLIPDYRSTLTDDVKKLLLSVQKSREMQGTLGGTAGIFVRRKSQNRHYLVTAAHNLFPECSYMSKEELEIFNKQVMFAQYDEISDVAMIEIKNAFHDNGLAVAPVDKWNISPDTEDCFKIGQRTGLTFSKSFCDDSNYKVSSGVTYKDMIQAAVDEDYCFATAGDSGSIYYSFNYFGIVPIAIHRISDKKNNKCYGVHFWNNFKMVIVKLGLDVDDFQPCQRGADNSCDLCHTEYFTKKQISLMT